MVTSDYNDYAAICIAAATDDNLFNTFKSNNTYRAILEHTSYDQGMGYLDLLEKHPLFAKLQWDEILKNDAIGTPIKSKFIINDKQVEVSPSTLRYVYYALETLSFSKQNNVAEPNIIEIGGGYGGQCFISHLIAPLLDVKIANYAILDLYGPSLLTNKYIQTQLPGTRARAYTLQEIELPKKKTNFLISNYAFAEFDDTVRGQYIEKVLKNTAYGYIVWNSESKYDSFFETCKVEEFEEKPKTGHFNRIITYINEN